MPRVSIIVAGLVALAAPAGAQRAASFAEPVKKFIVVDQPVILLRDARLWDGTGTSAKPGQDMLVRDGRIVAIGAGLAAPAEAKVIDAAGKTLMPGLVMMHEHLFREVPGLPTTFYSDPYVPQIMLAYGTTTARTGGSFDMEGDAAIKNAIIAGKAPGPDLDLTLFVNGPEPFFTLPGFVDDDAVRRHIAYWNGRGATSIKLWFNTTPAIAEVAIDEARRRGMTVAAHLCATFATTAAAMGINTLEHSMLAAYDIVPRAKEGDCPARERQPAMILNMAKLDAEGPEVAGVLSQLLAHGVAITPTISVRDEHLCAPKETPPARELALLAKFEPGTGLACFTGINHAVDLKSVAFQAATSVRYHRMGGTLVMGTDMGLVPGAMGPEELERMVAAGLTPAEVLVAATRNGAVALKRAKDIGTLEVGKRADFLLVDGKPDETISDIRKLTHVARDGIVYDPSKLYGDARGKLR